VGRRRKNGETSAARSGFRACPIFYSLVQELGKRHLEAVLKSGWF
jgi:hypothetical protein